MTQKQPCESALVYSITTDKNDHHIYKFDCQQGRLHFLNDKKNKDIPWAKLEHHQCPNCTLNLDNNNYCPIALNLEGLLNDWNEVVSYTPVQLSVLSNNRTIMADTTAQKALGSLLGLIMATSDCPHTQFFRPMAQYHLPLATSEETSFRAISTYLLTQYFRKQNGEDINFDLDGLSKIYESIHELNVYIKKRLMDAVRQDAALNAVMVLDVFTITSTNFLDDELERLRQLFSIL